MEIVGSRTDLSSRQRKHRTKCPLNLGRPTKILTFYFKSEEKLLELKKMFIFLTQTWLYSSLYQPQNIVLHRFTCACVCKGMCVSMCVGRDLWRQRHPGRWKASCDHRRKHFFWTQLLGKILWRQKKKKNGKLDLECWLSFERQVAQPPFWKRGQNSRGWF